MAMLGAVGGALLTGSISYISQSKLQKNLEQQKEAFQREQAASQAQAELEKVRAQANAAAVEAARTRLANHAAAVKQQIGKLNGKYWTVRLFQWNWNLRLRSCQLRRLGRIVRNHRMDDFPTRSMVRSP